MKTPTLCILFFALVGSLVGCEKLAYHPDELAAKATYEAAVQNGSEEKLTAALGDPIGVVSVSADRSHLIYMRPAGGRLALPPDGGSRSTWPYELRFLPQENINDGRVLVYQKGTVIAYYFISSRGAIVRVDVFIS